MCVTSISKCSSSKYFSLESSRKLVASGMVHLFLVSSFLLNWPSGTCTNLLPSLLTSVMAKTTTFAANVVACMISYVIFTSFSLLLLIPCIFFLFQNYTYGILAYSYSVSFVHYHSMYMAFVLFHYTDSSLVAMYRIPTGYCNYTMVDSQYTHYIQYVVHAYRTVFIIIC